MRHYAEHRLVAFVGAGCSMIPPTSLPSWWQVGRAVLAAMAREAAAALSGADALARAVAARQDAYKLPPEYFAEIMAGTIGHRYFDVLRALDSRTPNAAHRALARLARTGALGAIVTTNFDRCIEAAFEAEGVALDVRHTPERVQELAARPGVIGSPGGPCQLLKIHGSADLPDSLVDTLSQRKRGLPEATVRVLRHLLRWGHWLFLGYSGADLEADANYLFLRGSAAEARGFTWLVLEGQTPLPPVRDLAELYGDRAAIATGVLPAWLDHLLGDAGQDHGSDVPDAAGEPHVPVDEHVAAWAARTGPFTCGVLLTSLAAVAGETMAALEGMRSLYARHHLADHDVELELDDAAAADSKLRIRWSGPVSAPRMLVDIATGRPLAAVEGGPPPRHGADALADDETFLTLCLRLAGLARSVGDLDVAASLFRQAIGIAAAAGDTVGFARGLGHYANLLSGSGELARAERLFDFAIAAASAHPHIRGDLQNDLAGVLAAQGYRERARDAVRDALRIRTATGDEQGRAGALVNLAGLSPPAEAERYYHEALAILERIGDDAGCARVHINLGRLFRQRGARDRSAAACETARDIAARIGDRHTLAMALHGIAVAGDDGTDVERALALYHEALAVAESIVFKSEAASIHNNLGRLHRDTGNEDATRQARGRARVLYAEMNNPRGRAETAYAQGVDAITFERPDEAMPPLREALALFTELGDTRHRLESGNNLAAVLHDTGLLAEADDLYRTLLPEAEEHGSGDLVVRMATGIGKCAFRLAQPEDAVQWFRYAIASQARVEGPMAAAVYANLLSERALSDYGCELAPVELAGPVFSSAARQLVEQGELELGRVHLDWLLRLANAARDRRWGASTRANMGHVLRLLERPGEALPVLREAIEMYVANGDPAGALFPVETFIQIAGEAGDHDALADGFQMLAVQYEELGERLAAAEAAAQAAAFCMVPFGGGAPMEPDEMTARAERACALLKAARPVLVEHGSERLDRAEYDLAFLSRMLDGNT